MPEPEIAIIGSGPAGLVAALYAARYRRRTLVVHDNMSRLDLISNTHNVPAFPGGISGPALLARMAHHAQSAGAEITRGHVVTARRLADGFEFTSTDGQLWRSRVLILATGVHCERLPLARGDHDTAVRLGVLRYCPICDGFEHRGRRIAIAGNSCDAVAEALFLRTYSDTISFIPCAGWQVPHDEQNQLEAAGIELLAGPSPSFSFAENAMHVTLGDSGSKSFDVVYAALGTRLRSDLATNIGLMLTADGTIAADAPSGTDIAGLYCIGDMVAGLDQICVAAAQGAMAATHGHNWLRAKESR